MSSSKGRVNYVHFTFCEDNLFSVDLLQAREISCLVCEQILQRHNLQRHITSAYPSDINSLPISIAVLTIQSEIDDIKWINGNENSMFCSIKPSLTNKSTEYTKKNLQRDTGKSSIINNIICACSSLIACLYKSEYSWNVWNLEKAIHKV